MYYNKIGLDPKLKEIKIFISHSADTEDECQIIKRIINQETSNTFSRYGYKFNPICWQDVSSPGSGRPQDRINPYIKDPKCRLLIFVLWTRFGSPTGKADSGVEEEYEMALELPKEIMIYFSNRLINPSDIDTDQLARVKSFKKRIKEEKELMYWEFSEKEEFEDKFRNHFSNWGHNLIKKTGVEFTILTKQAAKSHKIPKEQIKNELRSIKKGF